MKTSRGLNYLAGAACLWSLACARLPDPARPLVPTPDEGWRSKPSPAGSPILPATGWPEVMTQKLDTGLTVMAAMVPGARQAEVSLVVLHGGQLAKAVMLATAIGLALEHDPAQLAPSRSSVDLDALTLSFSVAPDKLEAALHTVAWIFDAPPSTSDLDWAQKHIRQLQRRPGSDAALSAREELRIRLFGPESSVYDFGGEAQQHPSTHSQPSDISRLRETYLTHATAAVAIAAPLEASGIHDLAESILNTPVRKRAPDVEPSVAFTPRGPGENVIVVDHGRSGAVIEFGVAYPAVTGQAAIERDMRGRVVQDVLWHRLDRELRQRRAMTTAVGVTYFSGRWGGLLAGSVATDEAHVLEVLDAVRAQLAALRRQQEPQEYALALRRLLFAHELRSGQPHAIAASLSHQFAAGRPIGVASERDLFVRLFEETDAAAQLAARPFLGDPLFVVAGRSSDLAAALQWSPVPYEMAR